MSNSHKQATEYVDVLKLMSSQKVMGPYSALKSLLFIKSHTFSFIYQISSILMTSSQFLCFVMLIIAVNHF